MKNVVSKSQFKPRALEYFRYVEKTGKPLIVTDHGQPVLKIVPYSDDPEKILRNLRGSVIEYVDPTEPVALEDWSALK